MALEIVYRWNRKVSNLVTGVIYLASMYRL